MAASKIRAYDVHVTYTSPPRGASWRSSCTWRVTNVADANNLAQFLLEHPRVLATSVIAVRRDPQVKLGAKQITHMRKTMRTLLAREIKAQARGVRKDLRTEDP